MTMDPTTTKYVIKVSIQAEGVVEKPDVIGAIFGQTEGLLGEDLDLRDLQKSARIGRIEVNIESKKGKSGGTVILPSSLDKVETVILASALESIDRIGPCKAAVKVEGIDDVRASKRQQVIERAKELLAQLMVDSKDDSDSLVQEIKKAVRVEEIVNIGPEKLPAGPHVTTSDAIVVVEGRNDVANLLSAGIKNAIAVEGTSAPETIVQLCRDKLVTLFVDGDRGGELILKELLQRCEVDFVARAPKNMEVEELSHKQIMKALRAKAPAEQFLEQFGIEAPEPGAPSQAPMGQVRPAPQPPRPERLDRPPEREIQREPSDQRPMERPPERREERGDDRRGRRGRDRRGGRDRGMERGPPRQERGPMEGPERAPAPAIAGDVFDLYRRALSDLSGSLKAVFLNEAGQPVGETVAVRDLADRLRKAAPEGTRAVVFDGVVTQRLLDIAAEKGVPRLVGVKLGNVTKQPAEVEVITREKLGL